MSNTRPPYPPEFREQMVELVRSGRSPEELAREFEPSAQAIRNWVGRADRDEGRRADGLTSAERDELRVPGVENQGWVRSQKAITRGRGRMGFGQSQIGNRVFLHSGLLEE